MFLLASKHVLLEERHYEETKELSQQGTIHRCIFLLISWHRITLYDKDNTMMNEWSKIPTYCVQKTLNRLMFSNRADTFVAGANPLKNYFYRTDLFVRVCDFVVARARARCYIENHFNGQCPYCKYSTEKTMCDIRSVRLG